MSDGTGIGRRRRAQRTRWSVRALDVVARWVITVGGIGTVAAVSTVFVLLVWVVVPLMREATVGPPRRSAVAAPAAPLGFGVDDYRTTAWTLAPDGTLAAYRAESGEMILARPVAPGRTVTAAALAGGESQALGFADGSVALGAVRFRTEFLDADAAPEALRALPVGGRAAHAGGVAERVSTSQLRLQRLEADFGDPVAGASAAPVVLLDRSSGGGETVAALHADGLFEAARIGRRENLLTGEVTTTREELDPAWRPPAAGPRPIRLLLSERGDSATFIWGDGRLVRVPLAEGGAEPERVSLLPPGARRVTAAGWLLGRTTLLVGDDTGRVRAWFPAREPGPDGKPAGAPRLVAAHEFPPTGSAVTALAPSSRTRIFAAGHADGSIEVRHVTSGKLLARLASSPGAGAVAAVAIAPKENGLAALSPGGLAQWDFDPGHPETTLASLFLPVWYEGASRPEHVWQSSSGTDDFEPKLGLVPLIFGTIKATLSSLLFGVPIALLAALFTSEFLSPRVRTRIKPLVELMASLPSVVLGFLAALVIAPFAAEHLGAVLAIVITGPLAFLLGAHLWQLLPARAALRLAAWRFPAMFLAVPASLCGAAAVGPAIERLVFGGSLVRWLAGGPGNPAAAWGILLAPLAACALVPVWALAVMPRMRTAARDCTRLRCALLDLALFAGGAAAAVAAAGATGAVLAAAGVEPRGGFVGTYIQRNALVVGFVMGFAIIPIIYTIAEDALAAVPDHLRSASLASGATPWQTAWRIVIPTAMSGLFSAVMIGLGRAVGETMIVLMAAGNTPILDWNVFNGFRTLSANIAVELPEAVRNSTHYRTLFLAALVLFVMTFVLNTAAELVRIRFRRKASAL